MLEDIKGQLAIASEAVEAAFRKAVAATGAVVSGEEAQKLKQKAVDAYNQAESICKNLADVNGDGKFDAEDLKSAAAKAGLVWDKFDPDLREALLAGGVAAAVFLLVPIFGHALAVPVFAATTAYFFLFAKLKGISKK
jgi:hypothetical protein